MKNIGLLTGIILCFISWASAQCPDGPVILTSDEEINSFFKTYPLCTELDSSLFIGAADDKKTSRITSVASLKNIKKVNGDVIVKNNPWLESLVGIQNISYVKGNFEITHNDGIEIGLINSKLVRIDGNLVMSSFNRLKGPFCTFPALIKIGGSLEIYSFKPETIQFPVLWKVGENVRLSSDSGEYAENEFPELEIIGGDLTIYFDYIRADFIGFSSLKKVGTLFMHNTSRYKVYFGSIEECTSMNIRFDTPSDFYAFSKIRKLDYLNITNPSSQLISSFKKLKKVENLTIRADKNKEPISIDFPQLDEVDKLNLNGPIYTSLYTTVDTINRIHYSYFDEVNAKDLQSKISVVNELSIGQSSLTQIESFGNNISTIKLAYLKEMTALNGTAFSEEPIQKFWIEGSPKLNDISGIDKMNCQDCQIAIRDNKRLEVCTTDLICDSLINGKNEIYISNNGKLCNNKDQVRKQCEALKNN